MNSIVIAAATSLGGLGLLVLLWLGVVSGTAAPALALLLALPAIICILGGREAGFPVGRNPRGQRSERPDGDGAPAAAQPDQPSPVLFPVVSIDVLADPAILLDRKLRVLAVNAPGLRLLGQRILGEDLAIAVRHPGVNDAARRVLEGGETVEQDLVGLGRPEGLFRMRAILAGDDRLLMTFDDITQARLTERMRADFVANASHELRTPLATISGFIETLLGPAAEDEPARRRFLEIMSREANRMARLIDDLLSLSRIELDKYVQPRTPLNLQPLLADVAKTLAVRLDSDQRPLRVEVEGELPILAADRDQILQVLHNLLSNALKYGRTGTPILLRARVVDPRGSSADRLVEVSIVDQGDGIAPEHLPRLTERFYRVDNGRSRQLGGTGLGLAIVKHIIERHRGELTIDSQPGIGTTVSFTLPVLGSPQSRGWPGRNPGAGRPGDGRPGDSRPGDSRLGAPEVEERQRSSLRAGAPAPGPSPGPQVGGAYPLGRSGREARRG